jgi:hypothetical protein
MSHIADPPRTRRGPQRPGGAQLLASRRSMVETSLGRWPRRARAGEGHVADPVEGDGEVAQGLGCPLFGELSAQREALVEAPGFGTRSEPPTSPVTRSPDPRPRTSGATAGLGVRVRRIAGLARVRKPRRPSTSLTLTESSPSSGHPRALRDLAISSTGSRRGPRPLASSTRPSGPTMNVHHRPTGWPSSWAPPACGTSPCPSGGSAMWLMPARSSTGPSGLR